jgi:orsellinic acid C2-O-methyltransferase
MISIASNPAVSSEDTRIQNATYDSVENTPVSRVLNLIAGSWTSHTVHVAVELGIPDLLADGPRTATALSRATSCHAPSLARFMKALATIGICTERNDGNFELTAMGSLLRKDVPDSLHFWTLYWGRCMRPLWDHLLQSVRTGQSVRKAVTGFEGFERQEKDPDAAALFNQTMVELTRLVAKEVARSYDFSSVTRMVDVGGGYGELIATILVQAPNTVGTLFDLPHAMAGAARRLQLSNLTSRCECIAGDFFESVPAGADLYILKSVIHDWNDERAITILENCRRAMPPASRLLLVERVRPERPDTSDWQQQIARSDLVMLLGLGAQERTVAEFRRLLASARFRIVQIQRVALAFSLIEAIAE